MKLTYKIPTQDDVKTRDIQQARQTTHLDADAFLRELETHFEPETKNVSIEVEKPTLVKLGALSKDKPTISHLLVGNSTYKNECWKIIHDNINKNKDYTRIQAGTNIYLDPETKELVWKKSELKDYQTAEVDKEQKSIANTDAGDGAYTDRLADAVSPFMGKSYDEINCYELLVKGLKNIGVSYTGPDGLKRKLVSMASSDGLPDNAYLNGEGVTRAIGADVYNKVVKPGGDVEERAESFFNEIEPYLEKGYILSFSTPAKGHTGIIGKNGMDWTYINSGRMDNNVELTATDNGVGEEYLQDEIENWFSLADERGEFLSITLGKLSDQKVGQYRSPDQAQTKKA